MLHPFTFALAIFLAQDAAPPSAAPQAQPPTPPKPAQTLPAPLPAPKVQAPKPKNPLTPVAKSEPAPTSGKKDGKPLTLPTPRVKEPEVPSYRVSVMMPGNRRFTGVVTRDKLFNDLIRLNAHNTRDVYHRTEHFTLRFVDGVDGDVTLRWNQIVKLDVRAILDAAGLRTIEENYHRLMILKKEQEEAERARQEAEEAKAREQNGETPVDGEKSDKKEKEEELPPLLAEFRVDAGWSTKRKEEIEWRRTIVGTAPSAEEQRFLEVYPKWLEALNAWQEAHPAKPEGEKGEPAKDDDKKDDAKKDDSNKDDPKSGDSKKGDARKDGDEKDERKRDDSKKDDEKKDGDEDDDSKKDESPEDPKPAHDPKDDGDGSR